MRTLIFLALGFVGTVAFASDKLEPWSLPDPDGPVKASNALCSDQAKSALLAWHYARGGRTRDEVLALIPESPKTLALRLTSAMRENVEDTFAYPNISQYSLYSFRSEVCMRETLGAVRMPRLAAVRNEVEQCQVTYGMEKSNDLFKCIQAAVRKTAPQ